MNVESPQPHENPPIQGTISVFDIDTHSGKLLCDDGTELIFDGAAFDASGLRFLRPGQRVRVVLDPSGNVTLVTLVTMPI